jgi:hypothetical protein
MKVFILTFAASAIAFSSWGQVMVRNDFLIDQKNRRVHNQGITRVAFNLVRTPNWNFLLHGRGAGTVVVDVTALRHPRPAYSYEELAGKVYTAPVLIQPVRSEVPVHLLLAPPRLFPKQGGWQGRSW